LTKEIRYKSKKYAIIRAPCFFIKKLVRIYESFWR
jgi:hypothetical protein